MRRASVWAIVAVLVTLGVFSWRTPVIFGLYVGLLVPTVAFHWFYSCRTCTNVACALNVMSDEFLLGRKRRDLADDAPYSDTDAKVAGVPLVFVVGIGLYGAAQASEWAFFGALALLGVAALTYRRATCSQCTNDCPANGNAEYREWKRLSGE